MRGPQGGHQTGDIHALRTDFGAAVTAKTPPGQTGHALAGQPCLVFLELRAQIRLGPGTEFFSSGCIEQRADLKAFAAQDAFASHLCFSSDGRRNS